MDSRGDGSPIRPVRTSDRIRQRRKLLGRSFLYYRPVLRKRNNTKRRSAVSQIAKLLRPRNRPVRPPASDAIVTNLRRSTRRRKISSNLEDYETDSSRTEDEDLMETFAMAKRSDEWATSAESLADMTLARRYIDRFFSEEEDSCADGDADPDLALALSEAEGEKNRLAAKMAEYRTQVEAERAEATASLLEMEKKLTLAHTAALKERDDRLEKREAAHRAELTRQYEELQTQAQALMDKQAAAWRAHVDVLQAALDKAMEKDA